MGRPKGSKNKPKEGDWNETIQELTGLKPAPAVEEAPVEDAASEDATDASEEDAKGPQILAGRYKTVGLSCDGGYNYTVFHRHYYPKRTEVDQGPRWGVKVYQAGEYSKWKVANRPYQSKLENALNRIFEILIEDGFDKVEAQEVLSLADLVVDCRNQVRALAKGMKLVKA